MFCNRDLSGRVPRCSSQCNGHWADASGRAQERVDNSTPLNCQVVIATGSQVRECVSDSDVPYRTTSFL
jgi:hypothetical protein